MAKATPQNRVNDFELAVAAHSGNQAAVDTLWKRHRLRMIGMLGKYNNRLYRLSQEEMESEAAMVFMHKLMEIFRPEKVRKSPAEWSFSYMLTGGMRNHRDGLINKFRNHGVYVDEYSEEDSPEGEQPGLVYRALEWDDAEYTKYGPEKLAFETEWADARVEELFQNLTPFQRAVVKLRQAGMTIQQIADRMGCGYTKVRVNVNSAKRAAAEILCA